MHIDAIHVRTTGADVLQSLASVEAVAGKGLVGDRYFFKDGAKPGMALTLVEADVVADVGLAPGETRRQLTVKGTGLNDLVGKRFSVGAVECYGVELCEPCLHLQELTRPGIIKDLVHRAGLNADILVGGTIRVGDEVTERPAALSGRGGIAEQLDRSGFSKTPEEVRNPPSRRKS